MLIVYASSGNTALGNTIVTMIAFVALLMIIKKFTWEPFMSMLAQRRQIIEGDLAQAAEEKATSTKAKEDAQQALKDARAEANQIILAAKKQSLQIQDNMIKEAKEEIARLHESANQEIEQDRERILNEIKNEVSDISIEIAEKILRREIKEEDYHKLVDDFIAGMDDIA